MKFEDRLNALEKDIEEIKALTLELDEQNRRSQELLERMELQLQRYEQPNTTTINNGELLGTHGIMSKPKQVSYCELKEDSLENGISRR